MIDWAKISPRKFESLCGELLELNGFFNIKWYGKGGGDKGRDLTATKTEEPLSGIRHERSWVVQCKRYVKKKINKGDFENLFASVREHSPDALLLIVTETLSSDLKDWISAVKGSYKFDIYLWEQRDLEREISKFHSKLKLKIPILPSPGKPRLFYNQPQGSVVYQSEIYWEFEEVGFFLQNDYGSERNAEILRKFVDYIRHNELEFETNSEASEERSAKD